MDLDDHLCLCFRVSKRKILNYIRVHKPRRASQLSSCGSAGTGCGWCVPYLERCFREQADGNPAAIEPTAAEYARGRTEHIRAGRGVPPSGAAPASNEPPD